MLFYVRSEFRQEIAIAIYIPIVKLIDGIQGQ